MDAQGRVHVMSVQWFPIFFPLFPLLMNLGRLFPPTGKHPLYIIIPNVGEKVKLIIYQLQCLMQRRHETQTLGVRPGRPGDFQRTRFKSGGCARIEKTIDHRGYRLYSI